MAYSKEDLYDAGITEQIASHYREILRLLGEDPEREGLVKTPERVAKALQFLTQGYCQDGAEIIRGAIFKEEYRQMVLVRDIELYSTCEHHVMPFIGKAHVAYIPDGYITGLSKIARVVETYARRLQVQERLTVQIRDCIQQTLHPLGVAVVIEAAHTCMQIRGVRSSHRSRPYMHADQGSPESQCRHYDIGILRSLPERRTYQERISEPDTTLKPMFLNCNDLHGRIRKVSEGNPTGKPASSAMYVRLQTHDIHTDSHDCPYIGAARHSRHTGNHFFR